MLNANKHKERARVREELETLRRARILAAAFVLFLLTGVGGLAALRSLPFPGEPRPSTWQDDRSYASRDARRLIQKLGSPGLKQREVQLGFASLHDIVVQFPQFKAWLEGPLFRVYSETHEPLRKEGALRVLAQIRSLKALNALKTTTTGPVPVWALEAYLGSPRDPVAREILWRFAVDPSRSERPAALAALIRHRDQRAIELIPSLVEDPDPEVRVLIRQSREALELSRSPAHISGTRQFMPR